MGFTATAAHTYFVDSTEPTELHNKGLLRAQSLPSKAYARCTQVVLAKVQIRRRKLVGSKKVTKIWKRSEKSEWCPKNERLGSFCSADFALRK